MNAIDRLHAVLDEIGNLAVAVSGGVDSMTLAYIAHANAPDQVELFHAVSAAVPPDATQRVRGYAVRQGWNFSIIGTAEFDDPDYMRNPVNRCLYCKTNLYDTICTMTGSTVVSGTNTDDLSDFRPGLDAARTYKVRHPFVEAGIDKAAIRQLARDFGLFDLAELPAAPCLASRIETGLRIEADILHLVDRAEKLVAARTSASTLRVRVRREGIVIEMNRDYLARAEEKNLSALAREVGGIFMAAGHPLSVRVAAYERGSAFLQPALAGAVQ